MKKFSKFHLTALTLAGLMVVTTRLCRSCLRL